MRLRYVVLGVLIVVALIFFAASSTIAPVETAALRFPSARGPILVLVDRLPSEGSFAQQRAEQVTIALRYLTPDTSWSYIDDASPSAIKHASAVVYLGLNGLVSLASGDLAKLRLAQRLVLSEHHLSELRAAGVAFADVAGGVSTRMPDGTFVRYGALRTRVDYAEMLDVRPHGPARALADYALANGSRIPYIVTDGNALFVNGPLWFATQDEPHGDMLTACDAIAAFLGAPPNPRPLAMLRLEDVSAITPPARMATIAYYLWRAHVPYGIGVIPDLRVANGTGGSLGSNPMLVQVLRWAQRHGATIILHGLHHCCSSTDAEGYEFWDFDHNAPIVADSSAWMRAQITEGLSDERSLGLQPAMWETPHYSASPLDYRVVSQFFTTSWELRRPIGWLPWPLLRDQYGSAILPENLGYVSLDGTRTVEDQLARARTMLACRYCVAVGFLHPALIGVPTVARYVQGLRKLGYAFVDPRQTLQR